jgi:predicted RNase H-like HicB family nuclease
MSRRFTVAFERDESGWWVVQVKQAPAAISQGRTLAEARRRIRQALALPLGSDLAARQAILVEDIRLPPAAHRALRTLSASRTRLELEKHRVAEALDVAISELVQGMKLSVRDTGALLGLSHQRIQQLKALSLVGALRGTDLRQRVREGRTTPWTV